MPKFTITVERTVTAENQPDAISRFLERPFGFGATMSIVEVHEPEPVPKTLAQKTVATAAQPDVAEQTPICRDHRVAMQQKPSKFGKGQFYWRCPAKNADGSYCKYRPNGR